MTSNLIKNSSKLNIKDQRGITLLLAILVLAAIVVVTISFSTLATVEVRTTGDDARSEPAITAAEAGAEDALFEGVRGFSGYISANCANPTVTTLSSNNVTVSNCINYYNPDPYNFTMASAQGEYVYVYNPTNQSANPGYTSISVSVTGGGPNANLSVSLCSWTAANCKTAPDISGPNVVNQGQTWTYALNSTLKYQLYLLSGPSNADVSISTEPNGLPSSATSILTSGTLGDVTRKIQTTLPY